MLGPNFAIARAIYFRKISRGGEGFFEVPSLYRHVAGSGQYLGASRRDQLRIRSQGCLGLRGVRYVLGPVYSGSGYDESGNAGYYLFLGRTF